MNDPRHPSRQPPSPHADDPALRRGDARMEAARDPGPTLPLTATGSTATPADSAADSPADSSVEPTHVEPTVDVESLSPTMPLASDVQNTLDFVQRQVERKASAILRTDIGDYEIERELGRGGMGVVYKARHKQLRRDVALKMVLAGRHAGKDQLERFLTEARAVAQLQHPNIVQIFDIGEQEGLPYFSLEYVDGQSLAHHLGRKPQTPEEAGRTVELLARAMQYAHDHGVLHRDLKPANILLTKEGVPKITDFGLAKKIDDADESASTRTGTVMGTPSYMSPEQALGMTHEVGPAADQYSLGAILYEMLTGRPPFLAAKAVDTILQVIQNEPIPPRQLQPSIPVDLETICLKALQKDPGKRYASCLEFAEDARRFREGLPILARPVGPLERAWRWGVRNPRIAIPSLSAVALLLLVAIVSTWSFVTVSGQNTIIKRERDRARDQEQIAKRQTVLAQDAQRFAEAQEGIAVERAAAAKNQAKLVMDNMQFILTSVDSHLLKHPELSETRLAVLENMTKAWDKIDASIRDDEEGAAVPTLMTTRFQVASVYLSLGKPDLADAELQKLYELAKHRVQVKKGSDGARANLAIVSNRLGLIRQQVDRDMARSRKHFEEAIELFRDIEQNPQPDPTQPAPPFYFYSESHAEALQNLGVTYLREGQLRAAAKYFAAAFTLRTQTVETFSRSDREGGSPESDAKVLRAIRANLDRTILAQAEVHLRLKEFAPAEKLNLAVLERHRQWAAEQPQDVSIAVELARFCGHVGEFYLQTDRPEQARQLLEEAVERLSALAAAHPKIGLYREYLSYSLYRLGCVLDRLGDPPAAAAKFESSRTLRQALHQESPNNQKWTSQLMLVRARCGDIAGTQELIEKLAPAAKNDRELLIERARALAQCAKAAHADEQRGPLVDAAFAAIQAALELGYRDPFKIEAEADFQPLRDDPRFDQAIAQATPASSSETEPALGAN